MKISLNQAADILRSANKILILTHQNPDGDTVGSGFGLYYALKRLGKQVRVECHDPFPENFGFLYADYVKEDFEPEFILSVDIASTDLLGESMQKYADRIDMCIDHHATNTHFAEYVYLAQSAAANAEIIFDIIIRLGIPIDKMIADCLYTGIVTDTGCFRYSSTTAHTHLIAAKLYELGTDYDMINRMIFECKSKSRILLESMVLKSMEFYFEDKCAMIVITMDMVKKAKADQTVFDGISGVTKQIEGVDIGVTVRETAENTYKISYRTSEKVNAITLAAMMGGGGHVRASGCTARGTIDEVKQTILEHIEQVIGPANSEKLQNSDITDII